MSVTDYTKELRARVERDIKGIFNQDVCMPPYVRYELWDGEMSIMVQANCGAHGFYSVAAIVEHCDDPLEVWTKNYYNRDIRSTAQQLLVDDLVAFLEKQATPRGLAKGNPKSVVKRVPMMNI